MGVFIRIVGILGMIPGVTIAAFGFASIGTDRFVLLSCGISLCLSGIMMICLGIIIEHVYGMRKAHERILELLEERYKTVGD